MSMEITRRQILQLAAAPALLLRGQLRDLDPTVSKVYPGADGKLAKLLKGLFRFRVEIGIDFSAGSSPGPLHTYQDGPLAGAGRDAGSFRKAQVSDDSEGDVSPACWAAAAELWAWLEPT